MVEEERGVKEYVDGREGGGMRKRRNGQGNIYAVLFNYKPESVSFSSSFSSSSSSSIPLPFSTLKALRASTAVHDSICYRDRDCRCNRRRYRA